MLIRALLALLATATGCLSTTGTLEPLQPLPVGGVHVLFIGNSLTYVNDLPGTLVALAASAGDTVRAASVALPDFAVIDHALGIGGSRAVEAIKLGNWHTVILQQGPTSQGLSRDTLVLAARMLDPLVRAAGGRTALLMVWPNANQPGLFDPIRASYQAAAAAVGGLFLPVGEAWRAALAEDPALPLYGPDGFHPGELGTYLAALVIYEAVTGHNPQDLPGQARVAGHRLPVSEATVRLLQRVAHETVQRFTGQ
jgi:hypothetical protein